VRTTSWANAKRLPGTNNATYPFWAPDNQSIGFFADGKMKKIDMNEGPPQTICEAPVGRGGSWNKENIIIFSPNFTAKSIYRVSAAGGKPEAIFPEAADRTTIHPQFLPDQKHFLVQIGGDVESRGVYLGSLDSSNLKRLLQNAAHTEIVEPGFIFFVRENNLMVARFDLKKLEVLDEPRPIVENISFDGAYHSFSVSQNGVLAYSNVDLINTQLVWIDRTGKQMADVGPPGQIIEPTLSNDGKKLILGQVDQATGRVNLWTLDIARNLFSRLTNDPNSNQYGSILSPDDRTIVYAARGLKASFDLYQQSTSGTAPKQNLLEMDQAQFSDDWSQDGRFILFEHEDPKTKYDLWYLPLFGDRKPQPYVRSEFNQAHGRFSPDGKWVAYGSDEIGRSEIYVRRFPDAASGKWQISTGGGDQPYWRADGKELYYLAPNAKIMKVDVNAGDTFDVSVPTALFQTYVIPQGLVGSDRNQYVVTADGQRFLVNSSPAQAIFAPITLVYNWSQLLNKK
jgi:Tol biopolymer transport system component